MERKGALRFLFSRFLVMRPTDILILGFLIFLLVLTLLFLRQIPDAHMILTVYIALIAILFFLIYAKNRHSSNLLETIYDLVFPVMTILLIFESMGRLIPYIHPVTYDDLLMRIDYMIFKVHPTVALEKFTTPVLTEIMQIAYISYYFLPILLAIVIKLEGRKTDFNRMLFLVVLCFFLSYAGYIIVPAIGPRYTMNHLQSIELHGIFLRDSINDILNLLEGKKYDAFPSGHTAVALIVLYLAYRFKKPLFWVFLPIVFTLLISTVYLRYHYVVDVIAGVLLFLCTVYFGEKYYNYWEKTFGKDV